ncbi:site-2 protease family protein [Streptomyces sp. TRM68367]|uniref:site-2 protease family protein n=1 Tax=Streptomyces sp. TRM68367 TaxID=2758415 RepID=UPI00165A2CCE|nr:site-2 protease family protein [Streptomyces sp. TRM68367]MBC9731268.1 site-2 protease family protein [Streptomyces sp. TRM68367]
MRATFSLGHMAGIRVGVHWSVLVIFVLILVGLAQGGLQEAHPGRPAWQYWLASAVTAVFFLLSLLAHEISHALVARRNGVAVDDITLWLLGGLARLKSEASTPGAELRIAGVGPLVSLVLGVLFALAAGILGGFTDAGLAVGALAWLAGINILLAVFNALPAAPLDGGRLLRAIVWWKTGSPLRATAVATAAGRVLGWVLVGVGLYLVLAGAIFSGIWLVVIGWFVIAVATAEGGQARVRELLGGIPVSDAMTPDPVTVPAGTTVGDFLADPRFRYRHSAFPVIDDANFAAGLVTLKGADAVPETERASATVADVMVPVGDLPTPRPDDPLAPLVPELQANPAHRALVLEGGRVVGIVTSSDISRVTSWLSSSPAWRSRTL